MFQTVTRLHDHMKFYLYKREWLLQNWITKAQVSGREKLKLTKNLEC